MKITVLSIDAEPKDNLTILATDEENHTTTYSLDEFISCITLEDMINFQVDNYEECIEA